MADEFFATPATPETPSDETPEIPADEAEDTAADAFDDLEDAVSDAAPDGQYITFSVEAGAPIFVPLNEGETGITIADAITRRHLTLGGVVNAYVEGNQVPHSTFVPAGTVVTMIGVVKGG